MTQTVDMGSTIFTGTKQVKAVKMTLGEYNVYRGWTIPEDENPGDLGYLVEYLDGGRKNDERHAGYISWSPADVFERNYVPGPGSSFDQRLRHEKAELDGRLEKLQGLFDSGNHMKLPEAQVALLTTQLYLMKRMSETLQQRIDLL